MVKKGLRKPRQCSHLVNTANAHFLKASLYNLLEFYVFHTATQESYVHLSVIQVCSSVTIAQEKETSVSLSEFTLNVLNRPHNQGSRISLR